MNTQDRIMVDYTREEVGVNTHYKKKMMDSTWVIWSCAEKSYRVLIKNSLDHMDDSLIEVGRVR